MRVGAPAPRDIYVFGHHRRLAVVQNIIIYFLDDFAMTAACAAARRAIGTRKGEQET